MSHLGLLDDADHEAKYGGDEEYRKSELRIQALGAAISRRDWHAVETAYASIRDKFYSHAVDPYPSPIQQIAQAFEHGELPPMTGTDFLSDSPEEDLPPMKIAEIAAKAGFDAHSLLPWEKLDELDRADLLVTMRAAIEAIAPRLKAEGLREAEIENARLREALTDMLRLADPENQAVGKHLYERERIARARAALSPPPAPETN